MSPANASRRQFLRTLSVLTAAGTATPFAINLAAMNSAIAAPASGYRAMIYLNMAGGNDCHNTVLATDPISWASYNKYRDTTLADGTLSIALAQTGLLPIAPSSVAAGSINAGRTFALNPNLTGLQGLFASKRAAVIANVGPMIAPITAAQYMAHTVPVPQNLFSHNSQSATWQAFQGEGSQFGWGGRIGDLLGSGNSNAVFTVISASGNSVFLSGTSVVQLQTGPAGIPAIDGLLKNNIPASAVFTPYGGEKPDNTTAALQKILTRSGHSDLFAQDIAAVNQRSITAQAQMGQSLVPISAVGTPPIGNSLASQLQIVMRIMASASALGVTRQIFYVNMGGFDTHDGEIVNHAKLMRELDDGVTYFDSSVAALGLQNNVVLFSGSEFGRTFTSNGDGCDHGWGSHHFIVGGGVKGGDIYGRFPTLGVNNSDNVGAALLPQFSVDQFGATMARWMGVPDSSLNDVFPNLANFGSARDLGFMG